MYAETALHGIDIPLPPEPANLHGENSERKIPADATPPSGTQRSEPTMPVDSLPRLWRAVDLKASAPPRWLAKGRLPLAAISLLVGDEGIGKSLLWVFVAAAVTTGKALPCFGIPARRPARVLLVATEDDWSSTVRPRLEVAGADLGMVDVICTEDDGSGAPVFPRDIHLIADASPAPALVVVDAWLDTVSAALSVRDPQQARQALHPWKEVATLTDAAVLLICHTNRTASANPRDRYGATGELRKKARMTLYAQTDDDGLLVVGPEKMNTAAPLPASTFAIDAVQHFPATDDHDGTVPRLVYRGESSLTAREHLAASVDPDADEPGGNPAQVFLRDYLTRNGGEAPAAAVIKAGHAAGFSPVDMKNARQRSKPKIVSRKATFDDGWVWALPPGEGVSTDQGVSRDAEEIEEITQGDMSPEPIPLIPLTPSGGTAQAPPGGLTDSSPGQTDRVAAALANAERAASQPGHDTHTAYRAGLCIDCQTAPYSAGRPRCNACHDTHAHRPAPTNRTEETPA